MTGMETNKEGGEKKTHQLGVRLTDGEFDTINEVVRMVRSKFMNGLGDEEMREKFINEEIKVDRTSIAKELLGFASTRLVDNHERQYIRKRVEEGHPSKKRAADVA